MTPASAVAERTRRDLSRDITSIEETLIESLIDFAVKHGGDAALTCARDQFGQGTHDALTDKLIDAGWRNADGDWLDPDSETTPFVIELRRHQADDIRDGLRRAGQLAA